MRDNSIDRRTMLQTAGAGLVSGVLATSTSAAAVTDADGYRFVAVDQIAEGEVAELTITVGNTNTATVVLGDDTDGHVSAVELAEVEDEEIVLQYDASAANSAAEEFGWSVRDSSAGIENVEVDTEIDEGRSLPAHIWDLSIGDGLEESDGTYAVAEEYDRDVLVVTEHEGSDDDDEKDYRFVDVDEISEGEIAELTISVDSAEAATVVLGDDEDDHVSAVELEGIGEDQAELVLQYDTSAVNSADEESGWSVRDSGASIANGVVDTEIDEGQSLPAHNWDLSIGDGLEESAGTYAVAEEYDRNVLVVTEPAEIGDNEPADTTGDGLSNDITGNGETTHDDVVVFFEHLDDDTVQIDILLRLKAEESQALGY